jgi:hypothetical protein
MMTVPTLARTASPAVHPDGGFHAVCWRTLSGVSRLGVSFSYLPTGELPAPDAPVLECHVCGDRWLLEAGDAGRWLAPLRRALLLIALRTATDAA